MKKSDIFKKAYKEVKRSSKVIEIRFTNDPSKNGDYVEDESGNYIEFNRNTISAEAYGQEFFHAFTSLPENHDLHRSSDSEGTITDDEVESDFVAHIITLQLYESLFGESYKYPGSQDEQDKQDEKISAKITDGSIPFVSLSIFVPKPAISSGPNGFVYHDLFAILNSTPDLEDKKLNSLFVEYKKISSKYYQDVHSRSITVDQSPASYRGPVSEKGLSGLKRLYKKE